MRSVRRTPAPDPAPDPDDAELVRRVQRGDADAFAVLVERYEKKVYNLAYRYSRDPQEAEDLAQEVFIRLFRSLRTFRGDARFSTWLYRVTTNVCLDGLRRRRHIPEPIVDQPVATDDGQLERELAATEPGPEARVEAAEQIALLRREVRRLREPYRTVLILRDLQDLSYEEIADILRVSVGTVKSRLHRARSLLRERLEALELLGPACVNKDEGTRTAEGGEVR